jgi:capsular polysaccharide export protein
VQVEDGFIRSIGLGSSFHPASSLVLDRGGIYYDPASNSDLQRMLNNLDFAPAVLAKARRLREAIVEARVSKYNLGPPTNPPTPPVGRKVLLVPGQVENDASVVLGGGRLGNLQLLERVRAENPDDFLIYKPHPDVIAGNRPGAIAEGAAKALADAVVVDGDILACIEIADEVHTLTSLSGFEALLRDKPVVSYGWPFYAGWGLTRDLGLQPAPRRERELTLDQLVAGALLTYPLYLDPVSWLPCDALTFVERVADLNARRSPAAPAGPVKRYARALSTMLKPPRPVAY